MEKSKSLTHPHVMIGSKRHKITIVPDYTLFQNDKAILVLEAKGPKQQIVNSKHVEQTYSYAIHPDARCRHYGLCNGRKLVFYDISMIQPLFMIECKDILTKWEELEKLLLPKYLLLPELRKFYPDLGVQLKKLGVSKSDMLFFSEWWIQSITKSQENLYTSDATCNLSGLECLASFDYDEAVLRSILKHLPEEQAKQIDNSLRNAPYIIYVDCKIEVQWDLRLGDLVHGPHEDFIPLIVTRFRKANYIPSKTVGEIDPNYKLASVPFLKT